MRVQDLTEGATHAQVVVEHLSRTQIVMYAGASGDYNPLHTDEVYATQVAGYDSVLAHGQLTLGLAAKVVTSWVDEAELCAFGGRFLRQVWPGDTLTTTATVSGITMGPDGPQAELNLVTTNQHGQDVLTAYARVRSPHPEGGRR